MSYDSNLEMDEYPQQYGHDYHGEIDRHATSAFSGRIPSNLTNCPELRVMDFIQNKLIGNIPVELASLRKLEKLHIGGNNLTGGIPPSLGNISSLQALSIGLNNFVGNIPDEIGRLQRLSFFNVGANNLSVTLGLFEASWISQRFSTPPILFLVSDLSGSRLALSNLGGDFSDLASSHDFFGALISALFLGILVHLAISILFGFDYLVARLIMLLLGWLGLFTYFGDSTTYLFCYMFLTWMAHQYLNMKLKKLKGCTNHYVDGDNSSSLPVDQVLISKTEYDSLLQRANASSSLLIASGNTCLHSSSSLSWVIDSGASDHMTGNSSLLSHTSSPCSPSFVTVANGTKTPIQGKGTVTTSDLTLSDVLYLPEFPFNLLSVHKLTLALNCSVAFYPSHCEFQDLKTKRMIGGGFVKDGLYYFQPSSTSVPSALHSTNSPYQWHCRHGHPSSGRQLQESMLSAPVIPTHVPIAPPTSPISIVPPVPPISQVYVRRRNQDVPLVPPPPPVEFSLPLPPSASTSEDSPPPQSTSDLDLPIAIRKGKHTCTEHPISNCVFFDHLSPSFKAFSLSLSSLVVPKSYREALSHPGWCKAMEEEMHALKLNHTWDLIPKPTGTSIVGCHWVFTVKQNPDGTVDHLKARLVAKGFTQTYGLDYTETFSPVAKLNSIRIIISLATNLDWPLQLDVKNAFLHGDLTETVYMTQPPGFESKGECVCHLKKSIYGLKQSPRAWFDKFSKAVVSHGMTRSQADHSVFFKKTRTGIVILVVYVDDIVITGSDKEGIQILINHLSSSFLTKDLGKLRYFLGIEVILAPKPFATPMEPNLKLMPDEGDFVDDPNTYRRLVGKLIYLTITRPDISYAVSIVSQFMTNPRVPHMNAVIRILKYLKNAPGRGLFYRSSGHLRIEGYTDADWAGSPSDRKSTTGYCTFIGGNLVTWKSKKQSVVARSSAEAEYRAMAHTTCELTWLRTVLQEFGLLTQGPTPLYCDNQAAIHIVSNPVFHERTKHIEVDCHFVRSKVESKDIITPFVPSGSQLANIFTKALPKNAIDSICSKLRVIDIYSPA
uniref:Uncharacterized protein n=1 Tax=Fagus sylvatica TaxID=28930 RepID=A0A2N9H2N5_FAGSY